MALNACTDMGIESRVIKVGIASISVVVQSHSQESSKNEVSILLESESSKTQVLVGVRVRIPQ